MITGFEKGYLQVVISFLVLLFFSSQHALGVVQFSLQLFANLVTEKIMLDFNNRDLFSRRMVPKGSNSAEATTLLISIQINL